MIMCRAKVVGMARPNSRDRFPIWNSRWWVCSHSWHKVAFESADVAAGMEEGKEDSVVRRRVGPSGVEDILWLGTLDTGVRRAQVNVGGWLFKAYKLHSCER